MVPPQMTTIVQLGTINCFYFLNYFVLLREISQLRSFILYFFFPSFNNFPQLLLQILKNVKLDAVPLFESLYSLTHKTFFLIIFHFNNLNETQLSSLYTFLLLFFPYSFIFSTHIWVSGVIVVISFILFHFFLLYKKYTKFNSSMSFAVI